MVEVSVDYTFCESEDHKNLDGATCANILAINRTFTCNCNLNFNLTKDLPVQLFNINY